MSNSLFTNLTSSLTRGLQVRQCPRRIIRITLKPLIVRPLSSSPESLGSDECLASVLHELASMMLFSYFEVLCFVSTDVLPSRCSRWIAFG